MQPSSLFLLLCSTLLASQEHLFVHAEESSASHEPQLNVPVLPALAPPAITTTTMSPVDKLKSEIGKHCFYAEEELCNQALMESQANSSKPAANTYRDINNCQCHLHPTLANSWYCCNISHLSMITTCSNNMTNLHIRNISVPEVDLSNSIYQTLQSLAITDGNITRMVKSFSRVALDGIKCLNISNNNLSDISLRKVPNLKILDISKNNLTRIPNFNQNQNVTVDVSGNNHMVCETIIDAIYRSSSTFLKPESSFCLLNRTFHWFNATDYISIKEVANIKPLHTDCPTIRGFGACKCKKGNMITTADETEQKIMCEVDCSNMGLLELPPTLPENTFSLNVSNNKITSLGKHFHTETYRSLAYLLADNNQISSMYELEGTPFMDHVQRLYLRNNALTSIPEYLLNNVLDNHNVGRNIFLGGNKLQCDCNSAKVLKYWLLEHMRDIPDYQEIACRNMPQRVTELREMKLCQSPHDWTDYIYYLIATEVLLLLALIAKVSYDYWVFKTAGYLPWPASKMPKLPCDWLCES